MGSMWRAWCHEDDIDMAPGSKNVATCDCKKGQIL